MAEHWQFLYILELYESIVTIHSWFDC